jgi:hypothetical protein
MGRLELFAAVFPPQSQLLLWLISGKGYQNFLGKLNRFICNNILINMVNRAAKLVKMVRG